MKTNHRHNAYLVKRNRSMCNIFWSLYRSGMPIMKCYAEIAEKFEISEDRARHIIADKSSWK